MYHSYSEGAANAALYATHLSMGNESSPNHHAYPAQVVGSISNVIKGTIFNPFQHINLTIQRSSGNYLDDSLMFLIL
jgi:hypothetical protein